MTPIWAHRERAAADFTLFAALFGSALVGVEIVASDSWLWAVAPTHAYGLVAFVGIDAAMIVLLWRGVPHAGTLTALIAAAQLLAMGGDLAGLSPPPGIPAGGFASYLLSDVPFVVLLWLQPAIAYLSGLVQAEQRRTLPTLIS
jgi:hypothetical protein